MALRIFDTDPDSRAKERVVFDDGTIGRFHSGTQELNDKGQKVPVSLSEWEMSTGDADVSNGLAEFFNTEAWDTEDESENHLRVKTGTDRLTVYLTGPGALTSDMKQWYNGSLTHHCDGIVFLSGESMSGEPLAGTACGCPELFAERKAAEKIGRGPKPDIKVVAALVGAEDLGTFAFKTGSWTMAADLWKYEDKLAAINGPTICDLWLELVEFTPKKGKMAGKLVSYYKPVLDNIRSYDDANAE
jgi:hypothetical protein